MVRGKFFHNHFSDEPIYVSSVSTHGLAKAKTSQMISQRTPNTSNNGSLPQMWIQEKDSIYLYKAGTRPLKQQPINEAIGLAPIFDNGSSLLYLSPYETSKIPRGQDLSKAFRKHHVDEIELIKPPLNMPIEHLLDSLESILENGYNQLINPIFPKDRIMNLKHMLVGQIDKLIKYTD